MRNLLLLILLLSGYNASCQATKTVCLSVPQAAKIQDSLRVLPVVRDEALAWRKASGFYQRAADSLSRANSLNLDAVRASQRSFQSQVLLTQNETAKAEGWKQKARRRGLLNWIGLALAGGAAYLLLTH
jgi:hypothetical protein